MRVPDLFLCASHEEVNESTGQRVSKLVSDRSDKSDSSDAHKCKGPLAQKNMRHLWHISIIISVRYNHTDRKNRPFGLSVRYNPTDRKNRPFGLLLWGMGGVIIKSGVGVAYFKKLSYFCDSFLHGSMLFGLLLKC